MYFVSSQNLFQVHKLLENVKSRKNLFKIPSGKIGTEYISETIRLLNELHPSRKCRHKMFNLLCFRYCFKSQTELPRQKPH